MGATEEDAKLPFTEYHIPSETPRHEVTFDYQFAIGKFTVTVAEFAAFVEDTGFEAGGECYLRIPDSGPNQGKFIGAVSRKAGQYERGIIPGSGGGGLVLVEYADFRKPGVEVEDTQPATCISRNEAKAYLSWLSKKTGRRYRFPTEAEWEYATRAGETRPFFYGAGRDELCDHGNFADGDSVYSSAMAAQCAEAPSLEYTYPVGSFGPNNWGLFDMVGNVFEYIEDCYFPNYKGAPDDGSPWLFSNAHQEYSTPAEGACKVWGLRGYFFDSIDIALRSAARCGVYEDEDMRGNNIGMRVAVSISSGAWDDPR
ncbi:SUMF1/EgtB/PvdO family nonheme iron enzyme [Mesorhizobium sp. L-2-11]